MTTHNDKVRQNDANEGHVVNCCFGGATADDDREFLYLDVPPGEYDMPPMTLPLDVLTLAKYIPGSQARSMTEDEYRRMTEAQREQQKDL